MTPITLVVTDTDAAVLRSLAHEPTEVGAVIRFAVSRHDGVTRILIRGVGRVDDAHCQRYRDELIVASAGWVPHLAAVARDRSSAGWLHTHPSGNPTPSKLDARVDLELRDPFTLRTNSDVYLSVVLAPTQDALGFTFTAHGFDGDEPITATRMMVIGSRWRLVHAYDLGDELISDETYDRQVRAFGGELQTTLGSLRIGIVGAGGTGSAVAEQLGRLGVGQLMLVDFDKLSLSNTTRVYGSSPDRVGDSKVNVLAKHLNRIAPATAVMPVNGTITDRETAERLAACDIVFGCTDDEAGRLVLSRLATFQLIPVIDSGVLIDSAAGTIRGIFTRVTVLTPGSACLMCRGRVDPARAAAEVADPEEHGRLVKEGYAPELGDIEPAVVSYTTLAASLAVNELIERFVGFGPDPEPSEVIARVHDREISTNRREPRTGHYCDPAAGNLGRGDNAPFLGQAWLS